MTDGQTEAAEQAADQQKPDPLAEFVALEKRRRVLEAELKTNKEQGDTLREVISEDWADRGETMARVDGMTVYLADDFHCWKERGVETQAICDRLKLHGVDIVKEGYNASSLKSYVRERINEESEESLPGDIAELLDFGTEPKLKTRLSR